MHVPEIIPMDKLQNMQKNDIFVNSVSRIKSVNLAPCLKEGGDEEPEVAPKYYT